MTIVNIKKQLTSQAQLQEYCDLLEAKQVVAIEPVFAELLYGVRTPGDKERVLSYWNVSQFAYKHNYHNLGIGLMLLS
ncbi:MAG: hypothetical protein O2887_04135 [Bacteroidetes bacterium]|nr:hypothetical protein [Bacteroidota bacterium]MDA1119675.1 hypothetical protein [Bacteroidota bacterium]